MIPHGVHDNRVQVAESSVFHVSTPVLDGDPANSRSDSSAIAQCDGRRGELLARPGRADEFSRVAIAARSLPATSSATSCRAESPVACTSSCGSMASTRTGSHVNLGEHSKTLL